VQLHRRNQQDRFAVHAEQAAARREDAQPAAPREKSLGQLGDDGREVLTVVENEKGRRPERECVGEDVDQAPVGLGWHAKRVGNGAHDPIPIVQRGEVDEPYASRKSVANTTTELDGETGLATPAGSGDRDEAMPPNRVGEIAMH
jgi:hypothetical protein